MKKICDFPDGNFAVIYFNGHEAKDAFICLKSRSGHVIMVPSFPIMWLSKLRSETVPSTMEAELLP